MRMVPLYIQMHTDYLLHTRRCSHHQKYSPKQDKQDSAPAQSQENLGMPVNLCKGSEIVYGIQ